MANLSKVVCHGESHKCRFGNPPQESNFQRLGIRSIQLAEINPATCTKVAVGAWTHTAHQLCGKDASGNVLKCGEITRGTETVTEGSGVCAGSTFTFATIYYEWTAHNNQSNLSAPPNSVADTFEATWAAPDGSTALYTFNGNVPVVRPDHETNRLREVVACQPNIRQVATDSRPA